MKISCNRLSSSIGILIVLVFATLLACGGGGGGGGTTTAAPSLTYTGLTAKAVIDESNAADISAGAVNGGLRGNLLNGFASLASATGSVDAQNNKLYITATILQKAVVNLQSVSQSSMGSSRAVSTEQETVTGACGGQALGSFHIDDGTGDFWGNFSFSNYCESDVTINGAANFSGSINLSTDEIESITFDLQYLTGTQLSGSYIIDGSLVIVNQSTGFTISMNMYLQNGNSSDVFWISDYHMEGVEDATNLLMNISGNFYDPEYGHITLSTLQDLTMNVDETVPSSGILAVVGENGPAGGPTMAKLTCYPSGLFQVEADTNGDGIYDWDSGTLSWDDY